MNLNFVIMDKDMEVIETLAVQNADADGKESAASGNKIKAG